LVSQQLQIAPAHALELSGPGRIRPLLDALPEQRLPSLHERGRHEDGARQSESVQDWCGLLENGKEAIVEGDRERALVRRVEDGLGERRAFEATLDEDRQLALERVRRYR
jgi:hypothetical protein